NTATVAVAAERYRRAKKAWPETIDALVQAGYLKQVPRDPFDGAPLRLKRQPDSLIVYSVGPDGKDDGGKIDRQHPTEPGTDLGFQLWDVAKRRQPPLPPKPAKADDLTPGEAAPGAPPQDAGVRSERP